MKRNAKRLLCAALCLMMVLSILPMAAFAAGTTLYCKAPSNWKNCNVYWWGSSESNPGWPGEAMSQNDEGIWYYDVPSDATNVIFNNGSVQSADLVMPSDENVMFTYQTAEWSTYDPTPGPVVEVFDFYVAGEAGLCGIAWAPDASANGMTDTDGDGIYTKTYENVAAGTYEFKVTDGTWTNSWGGDGPNGNYSLVLDAETTVEIRFDATTSTITVVLNGEEVEEPTTEPTEPSETEPFVPGVNEYCLIGYINGADYGCNDDSANVGEYIFVDGTLSTSFNADSYIFIKTTDNASWYLTEAYTEETSATFIANGTEKMKVPGGVELTFTLVENEDGTLILSYVTGEIVETEPTVPTEPVEAAYYVAGSFNGWTLMDETCRMTDNGDGTWTLVIADMTAGNYEFKVNDGTWANSWGSNGGNITFKVGADGDDVTITFNAETYEITVDGGADPDPLPINDIYVAGQAGLVGVEWDPSQNKMTANGSVYTITFTNVNKGTYEFKFVANGTWDLNWASGVAMPSGEVQTAYRNASGNSSVEVAVDGSTVTLTLDLTTMDVYTGEGATSCATIEEPAIADDFTGLRETAEGTFYYVNGVQSTATGLTKIDGVWYYLKSGRWASELNQLAKYNGEWWYLVDGKVASTTTALIDLNGEDWYVVKGKIAANTTGLIKVDGVWYYVVKGKVAGNTTSLIKYNGEWFYVVKGKVASDITSMVLYNGEWFYMVKGKLAAKTTTLVKHNGKWCYVIKGKLAGKTTTLVKYNGEWFYVINGYVDSQTTGIVKYSGGLYYLVKGKIASKTTTLAKYSGAWYYVSGGSVDWKYTGTFVFGGKTYNIKSGKVV